MRTLLFTLLLALSASLLYAQSDRIMDRSGALAYQYNRTIDTCAQGGLIVHFTFINGSQQTAISLRQETLNGSVQWLLHPQGTIETDHIVTYCTANLPPNATIAWRYHYLPAETNKTLSVERSALMVTQSDFLVKKILFPPANPTTIE